MTASTNTSAAAPARTSRRPWQRPELHAVGALGDVLKGGNAKVTATSDPGPESGKAPGGTDY